MDWDGFAAAAHQRIAALRVTSDAYDWRDRDGGPAVPLARIDALLIARCVGGDPQRDVPPSERAAWGESIVADLGPDPKPHLITNSIRALSLLGHQLAQRPRLWRDFLDGDHQPAAMDRHVSGSSAMAGCDIAISPGTHWPNREQGIISIMDMHSFASCGCLG